MAGVAAACCLLLGLTAPAATQESTTSTTSSTSSSRLSTTTLAPTEGDGDDGLSTGTVVLLITIGLVVAALVLSAFTWRYWRVTKPGSGPVAADAQLPRPVGESAPTV